MIRKNDEKVVSIKEKLFDGEGQVTMRSLLNGAEEMYGKGRVFGHSTLQPGCSIGYHVHHDESETYYFLSGLGEFNDNGNKVVVQGGDVTCTGAGEGHGIKNIGNEPLEFITLILFK